MLDAAQLSIPPIYLREAKLRQALENLLAALEERGYGDPDDLELADLMTSARELLLSKPIAWNS